ncbi:unnamed protein product [Musa acuminata subsp. malaccensis]|uniref:(wild Malaysian banana) hypothetical protein n=1 Tax=Musa acuminata subsp. malaccensis TaxID=214687 RepID=A0A804K4P1_MUSAM|nr:unnamed protein product [Musa acuminata subsp. malaccensis]
MGVDPEAQFHVLAVDDMTVSSTESSLRGFSGHLPTEGGTLTANGFKHREKGNYHSLV